MRRKEKLHLLPALLVVAENDTSPVTYLVLSLRLCSIGGERACRALLDELKSEGYIEVERQNGAGDQREKVVRVTDDGWDALSRYTDHLIKTNRSRPSYDSGSARSKSSTSLFQRGGPTP